MGICSLGFELLAQKPEKYTLDMWGWPEGRQVCLWCYHGGIIIQGLIRLLVNSSSPCDILQRPKRHDRSEIYIWRRRNPALFNGGSSSSHRRTGQSAVSFRNCNRRSPLKPPIMFVGPMKSLGRFISPGAKNMDNIRYAVQYKECSSNDWINCWPKPSRKPPPAHFAFKTNIEARSLFLELVREANQVESARIVSMWLVEGHWKVKDVLQYRDLPRPPPHR